MALDDGVPWQYMEHAEVQKARLKQLRLQQDQGEGYKRRSRSAERAMPYERQRARRGHSVDSSEVLPGSIGQRKVSLACSGPMIDRPFLAESVSAGPGWGSQAIPIQRILPNMAFGEDSGEQPKRDFSISGSLGAPGTGSATSMPPMPTTAASSSATVAATSTPSSSCTVLAIRTRKAQKTKPEEEVDVEMAAGKCCFGSGPG